MKLFTAFLSLALASLSVLTAKTDVYDPMRIGEAKVVSETFEVTDTSRERTLPLRVYLPDVKSPAPVILFSHGLGGSRDNNPYLGNHWAARGYVAYSCSTRAATNPFGRNAGTLQRVVAMKQAASAENFLARNKDIPVVIDALTQWNAEKGHVLRGRLDLEHLGMSGHSFGAVTTQAVAGEAFLGNRASFREPRIDAAVMMSPSAPASRDAAAAFLQVKIPCLLMTGTADDSPIGNTTAVDRLKVFAAIQSAPAWQVVFDKATHMTFGDRAMGGKSTADPRYHRAILALTTAFWDANLKGDAAAKSWLNGSGAKSVLDPADQWLLNAKAEK